MSCSSDIQLCIMKSCSRTKVLVKDLYGMRLTLREQCDSEKRLEKSHERESQDRMRPAWVQTVTNPHKESWENLTRHTLHLMVHTQSCSHYSTHSWLKSYCMKLSWIVSDSSLRQERLNHVKVQWSSCLQVYAQLGWKYYVIQIRTLRLLICSFEVKDWPIKFCCGWGYLTQCRNRSQQVNKMLFVQKTCKNCLWPVSAKSTRKIFLWSLCVTLCPNQVWCLLKVKLF